MNAYFSIVTFLKSFSYTSVISTFFKFDGNTEATMQLLRFKKKKSANVSLLF